VTAGDANDERIGVLDAVSARLALPVVALHVFVDLAGAEQSHFHRGHRVAHSRELAAS